MSNSVVVSKREVAVVLVLSAGMATYRYLIHPQNPFNSDQDMFGWYDQSQYINIARILANFHLPMGGAEYSYGLGYPVVAVPFIWLGFDKDPFIVPSVVLMSLSVLFTYVTATRWSSRSVAGVTVALLLVASPLVSLTIVPWSTSVTTFGITSALALATSPRGLTWLNATLYGAIGAWVFSARFVDVIPVIAIAGWAVVSSGDGERWRKAAIGALVATTGAATVAITQSISFGSPFITPYAFHLRESGVNDQSLGQYQLSMVDDHFFETFVSGLSSGVRVAAEPLLAMSPFLILVPAGFAVAINSRLGQRSLHITYFSTTLILTAVYLSFVAGGGADLVYQNVRYWIEFYPYWTILGVIAGRWAFQWMTRGGQRPSTASGSGQQNPETDRSSSASESGHHV